MSTDIQTAARALMEAAERARRDALVNLEAERIDCRALIRKYDKARERLARLDAEYARVEAQKIEDIARQALERAQKCDGDHIGPLCADKQCWLRDPEEAEAEKPEPHRAGLPPERLRKVWAEWENIVGDILMFTQDGQKFGSAQFLLADVPWAPVTELDSNERYRPHGATWARVEAMADEADKSAAPKMLDLRTLKVGTEVQMMERCNTLGGNWLGLGQKVHIAGISVTENDGSTWCIAPMQSARVVKEGGEQ